MHCTQLHASSEPEVLSWAHSCRSARKIETWDVKTPLCPMDSPSSRRSSRKPPEVCEGEGAWICQRASHRCVSVCVCVFSLASGNAVGLLCLKGQLNLLSGTPGRSEGLRVLGPQSSWDGSPTDRFKGAGGPFKGAGTRKIHATCTCFLHCAPDSGFLRARPCQITFLCQACGKRC